MMFLGERFRLCDQKKEKKEKERVERVQYIPL